MNLAAILIIYHPTIDTVSHIQTYFNDVDKLFIFDNTEHGSAFKNEFIKLEKVSYFYDGENKGISIRLNQGCQLAIDNGYDWFLLLDQDSSFNLNSFIDYKNRIEKYNAFYPLACFSPFLKVSNNKSEHLTENFSYISALITSGTMLPKVIFKTIGLFDENLFIDLVDSDYSIRIRFKKIDIIAVHGIDFIHNIGNPCLRSSFKTLFLFKKRKIIHSPLRCYYIIRNYFYLQNKICKPGEKISNYIDFDLYNFMLRNILYGGDLFQYLKYIYKGYMDFKNKKFGKINILQQ